MCTAVCLEYNDNISLAGFPNSAPHPRVHGSAASASGNPQEGLGYRATDEPAADTPATATCRDCVKRKPEVQAGLDAAQGRARHPVPS